MVKVMIAGPQDEVGEVRLQFDDHKPHIFAYDLQFGDGRRDRFDVDIPTDCTKITYARDGQKGGQSVSGWHTAPVYNVAAITKCLWDEDRSFCRRVLTLNRDLGRAVFGTEPDEYGYRPKPRGLFSPYRLRRDDKWLKPMYSAAAAAGCDVPAALASFAKLSIEPDMGGGVWCGPGQKLVDGDRPEHALSPNIVIAKAQGPDGYGVSQAQFDVLMALYDRAITVAGDANHFSGVIWDPVGLSAEEAALFGGTGDHTGPDGVFWHYNEDRWAHLQRIKDADGNTAGAEQVIRDVFMEYFLRDIGQGLNDEERVPEDTVFIDTNAMPTLVTLNAPDQWQPVWIELYQRD